MTMRISGQMHAMLMGGGLRRGRGRQRRKNVRELGLIDLAAGGLVVACSADSNVLVSTTDDFDSSFIGETNGEGSVVLAKHANGTEFDDGLAQWHQIQHLAKGLALERSIQSSHNHNLAPVGYHFAKDINVGKLSESQQRVDMRRSATEILV